MTAEPIARTRRWVEAFVVGLDLCPFAQKPLRANQVRFALCEEDGFEYQLSSFVEEVEHLVRTEQAELSNTLLILTRAPGEFDTFLDVVAAAEAILEDLEVDHLFQLASFHPDYRFAGAPADDPANATNQSPFPMLHLLRVDEVEDAIARHPDIDSIPKRNAELLRERRR